MRSESHGLVTIVLPTYNRAPRLEAAIESCLGQSYSDIELIVVDDGSTDHTSEIVTTAMARDSRVRSLRQQNQGLPRALNAGFQASKGEFLTWTSDDNQYRETAVEIMVRGLIERPDVGLVYCDYELVNDLGEIVLRESHPDPRRLFRTNCVGACFLYRREVYLTVGEYNPDFFLAEDYDYWLRVAPRFKMAHLPEVCPYRYGVHSDTLRSRCQAEIVEMARRVRLENARGMLRLRLYLKSRWRSLWQRWMTWPGQRERSP